MNYVDDLGDVQRAIEEVHELAWKKAKELCEKNMPELSEQERAILIRSSFNNIFLELLHDVLIVSRRNRGVLRKDLEKG